MADPATDFLHDYQALARQSWDAWSRQLQQSATAPTDFLRPAGAGAASGNDTLQRTLDGLQSYMQWMQGTAASATSPSADWQQQLQQWFGGGKPFAQAFGGIDSAGVQGFAQQWQTWLQAAQGMGLGNGAASASPTPAFGMDREQQMQQQALGQAMLAAMQASARYQTLIQRAGAQGMQRLQDKLAQHAEPGRQIDSLKGLYDLWVDAGEEAYAEIALTDEFRSAYGEMVNTQMRVRQLQQKHTEALCQQLGIPTRSEVSSLGERLQALRRELRAGGAASAERPDEVAALRRDLAALKRQLDARTPSAPVQTRRGAGTSTAERKSASAPARKPAAAVSKTRAKTKAKPRAPTATSARKPAAKAAARRSPPATNTRAVGKRVPPPKRK